MIFVFGTSNKGWQDTIDSASLGKTDFGHPEKIQTCKVFLDFSNNKKQINI